MLYNREEIYATINSKDRSSGTATNFSITLANSKFTRIRHLRLNSIMIPFTYYVFTSTNNTLVVSDTSGTDFDVTITAGSYTANTLGTHLATRLDADVSTMSGFAVTYNRQTYKLTITNAANFTVKVTGTAHTYLGFSEISSTSTSVTSDSAINLYGPSYLFIKSNAIGIERTTKYTKSTSYDTDIIYRVSVDTSPGNEIYDENIHNKKIVFKSPKTFQTLDFSLEDPNGNTIDLNGHNWSFELIGEVATH